MIATLALEPATVAALLRAQGTAIHAELTALPPELCRWQPAAGEWSLNETLGHMIEAERRGFNGRIRRILAEDNPALPGWNQEQVAQERRDAERDPAELLREFEELRAESVALVGALRPEQLGRRGVHEQVGEISVADLTHEWVHHDRNHVKQMLSVMQAYTWPQMGNCRRFSEFD